MCKILLVYSQKSLCFLPSLYVCHINTLYYYIYLYLVVTPWVEFQLNANLSEQHKRNCLSKSEVLLRKFTLQGWGYILMIKHLSSTGTWALSPAKHTCMYTHTCTFYRWETRVECYDISSLKSPSYSSVILAAARLLTTRFLHLSSDNPSTAPLPSPASAWGSLFWPIFSLSDTWTSKFPQSPQRLL